jgi:two-component system, chemotaxis family, chemotaxis protein CheY
MSKVLVVDDDPEVRAFVSRVLTGAGHSVREASEGGEALRLLEASAYDLIISDVYMAEMDGMELLVRIQQRGTRVPVVVISGGGYATKDEVLTMAASCGAVATLEKPFTPRQLREVVERLLRPPQSAG